MAEVPRGVADEHGMYTATLSLSCVLHVCQELNGGEAVMGSQPRARGAEVSAATDRLQLQLRRVGPHFRTALVRGERGLRKEKVARELHAASPAAQRVFVVWDADRIDDQGFEDLLSEARGGTIFIRELGQFSTDGQRKLLRLVDAIESSGGERVRLIASVSAEAQGLLEREAVGAELLERLGTIELTVAPLRERPEEIEAIAARLLEEAASLVGMETPGIADEALLELQRRDWPGNERELESLLRMAMLESGGAEIEERHLGAAIGSVTRGHKAVEGAGTRAETNEGSASRPMKLQDVVDLHLQEVLRRCEGNKVRAAEMLGISRSTLYRMLDAASMAMESRDLEKANRMSRGTGAGPRGGR